VTSSELRAARSWLQRAYPELFEFHIEGACRKFKIVSQEAIIPFPQNPYIAKQTRVFGLACGEKRLIIQVFFLFNVTDRLTDCQGLNTVLVRADTRLKLSQNYDYR